MEAATEKAPRIEVYNILQATYLGTYCKGGKKERGLLLVYQTWDIIPSHIRVYKHYILMKSTTN